MTVLRMAWREALRAKARTALVLVMIALPVAAVSASVVLERTSNLTSVEALPRTVGAAQARIDASPYQDRLEQFPDPNDGIFFAAQDGGPATLHDAADVSTVLGDVRLIEQVEVYARVQTERGFLDADLREIDLRDPALAGTYRLRSGRLPATSGEVVVSPRVADRAAGVGGRVTVDDVSYDVVGVVENPASLDAASVTGLPDSFAAAPEPGTHVWFVDSPRPVTWADVQALNRLGMTVVSRAVILDPPDLSALKEQYGFVDDGLSKDVLAVVALIVVMALLEVALLAGPAFAVGARSQSRTLALIVACGGTPRHARRVVLASAVVLGALAAVLGAVVGVLAAYALVPFLQRVSGSAFGPFEVPALRVLVAGAFGFVAALLAAVVPAWLSSRQDVVAVLAGRRGDPTPSRRSPWVGLVVMGLGVLLAWRGATGGGEFLVAVSALVTILGMLLVIPLVLAGVARLVRGLPLPLRYAARDGARHRTRTVPAVAAVAATVAGVVALGIGNASDAAQNEGTYLPSLVLGTGAVTGSEVSWEAVGSQVRTLAPALDAVPVRGLPDDFTRFAIRDDRGAVADANYTSSLGSPVVVADPGVAWWGGLDAAARARAEAALLGDGIVVFAPEFRRDADVRVRLRRVPADLGSGNQGGPALDLTLPAPATSLVVRAGYAGPLVLLSPAKAAALATPVAQVGLTFDATGLARSTQDDLTEALAADAGGAYLYVERGYQPGSDQLIIQLLLFGLATVLLLGGTLTATFLALADARPDLATLSAVGAAPRLRRAVAAAYAVMVAGVGALLGALVGLIPGIAVSLPLTRPYDGGVGQPDFYLALPWGLMGAVILGLPLLSGLIVALTTRSKLPLTARLA